MESSSTLQYYLEILRQGDWDNAFHGLRDFPETIPELQDVFRNESDPTVREFLVHSIWQFRDPSVIPFLGEALRDLEPEVWQQALDGLVALASPASLEVLQAARTHQFPKRTQTEEFHHWLEEALNQVLETMQQKE